jgi:molybdopterin-containing oxidoreductase family iron-sulfur binding subunit
MADGIERREFLKVIGVTGAGAGLVGCSGPSGAEKLLPYVIPHEEIVPGMATWYRTTCRECPAGCGMDIRTREGRAVKAEGNPLSPISHGKLCARGQASLHGLYNPDRVPSPLSRSGETWQPLEWEAAEAQLAQQMAQHRGRGVFLTQGGASTMDALVDQFCSAMDFEHVRWTPFALEPIRAANRALFGIDALPVHDFANADVVITFGADFLETWISPVDYMHGWVQSHAYDQGRRGTLISVTPHQSLTDMNSDEWLAIVPGTEHLVALALARLVMDGGGSAGGSAALLGTVSVEANAQAAGITAERLRDIATRFANGGRSLAVGPGIASTHRNASAVAAAVALLNAVAGNFGTTIALPAEQPGASGSYADVQRVIQRIASGEVTALLVNGVDLVHGMPEQQAVTDALGRLGLFVSFSTYLDDTSARAQLLLPDHHFLESWDDSRPRAGIDAIVQPVMMPVFSTKQTGDVLLSVARRANAPLQSPGGDAAEPTTWYDWLRGRWRATVWPAATPNGVGPAGPPFEEWWRETLKVGFTVGADQPPAAPSISAGGLATIDFSSPASFDGDPAQPVLVVYPSYKYYDGRMANRPWLQELPDPMSKFTWGSWIEVHPDVAHEMGLDNGHLAEVETAQGTVQAPVWHHPGMRPDVIAVQLGQGHEQFGTYAESRGVNAVRLLAPLTEAASGSLVWQQTRAELRPVGRWRRPSQAGLHASQRGRNIAQATTLVDAAAADRARGLPVIAAIAAPAAPPAEPAEAGEHAAQHPMDARVTELQESGGFRPVEVDASPMGYPPPNTHYGEYSGTHPRWAMVVDLEKCTGCSACITACYAENNIGIVGPELVAQGRIQHWIRLERYWEGEGETLQTRFLPMMCQHCGNAPCESVCPVFATYHTPDGLNAQVYNRCVGTRYCANNCPYKVRVYNWFSWEWPEPLNWQLNPDVTVREKGVMEKCTFCVQRIREAENDARMEGRGVRDGEITPACAQTCPGDALVFGNIRDPNSRVAQVAESGRGYRVLEQLNTQSAVIYLKKVSEHANEPATPGAH